MGQSKRSYSKESYQVTHSVQDAHDGMRLDQFMMQYAGTLSRKFIQGKIKRGEITISGREHQSPHKANSKVHSGEIVTMVATRGNMEDEYWDGKLIEFDESPEFAFENEDLLVMSKPPYMSAHPTGRHLFYCATIYAKNYHGNEVYAVHRLDRETSGLMVFAKDPKLAGKIIDSFERREVKKVYFLISKTSKALKDKFPFTADENIGREHDGDSERMVNLIYPKDGPRGKTAITDFQLLFENESYKIALAFPKTGRQHQIRVHANHHGFPLLGDKLYPDREYFSRFKDQIATKEDIKQMEISRHALHSIGITFPYKKSWQTIVGSIPLDLKQWIQENLKIDTSDLEKEIKEKIKGYFAKS